MLTWRLHLAAVLQRLLVAQPNIKVEDAARTLATVLDADEVRLEDHKQHPLPADAPLHDFANQGIQVHVRVAGKLLGKDAQSSGNGARLDELLAPDEETRFQPGEAPASRNDIPTAQRDGEFIREFARLEQSHDFMWAGYVVRELLPRLGYPSEEAKLVLDRFCADGILSISKIPNPRNPSFPATGVVLNRDHARVIEAIGISTPPSPADRQDKPPTTPQN